MSPDAPTGRRPYGRSDAAAAPVEEVSTPGCGCPTEHLHEPTCAVARAVHAAFTTPTEKEGAALVAPEQALARHFYRAACAWAKADGEPVEALIFDRFVVAAQDWLSGVCSPLDGSHPDCHQHGMEAS